MALDFPQTPLLNDIWTDPNGIDWTCTNATAGRVTWERKPVGAGNLLAANNLTDVANAATSLSNLGGAPLASPALTGVPTAPTAATTTNTTQIASTAFVQQEITAIPAAAAGLTLLSTIVASNSTTVDFTTGIDLSVYDEYIVEGIDIEQQTDGDDLRARVKAGGTWQTSSYESVFHSVFGSVPSTSTGRQITYLHCCPIALTKQGSANANQCFTMNIKDNSNITADALTQIKTAGTFSTMAASFSAATGITGGQHGFGYGAFEGIRFYMSTGNITKGTFRLYGVTK